MTKERPILFSAPMVRALLAGTKTQTRRAVRKQFAADAIVAEVGATTPEGWQVSGHSGLWWDDAGACMDDAIRCPYGMPGDRLWVRESFCDARQAAAGRVLYRASSDAACRWTPSIHMPRTCSRILLEVTGVRVERLQAISEADAIAEGIEPNWVGDLNAGPNGFGGEGWTPDVGWRHYLNSEDGEPAYTAGESYRSLWDKLNGVGAWDANPWVWVVSFKVKGGAGAT